MPSQQAPRVGMARSAWTPAPERSTVPRPTAGRPAALAAFFVLLALGGGVVAGAAPHLALVLLLAAPLIVLLVVRLHVAVAVLVASFFFDGYLATSDGLLSPSKLVGVLACVSFLHHVLVRRRPIVLPPLMISIVALTVWMPVTLAAAYDQEIGRAVALRYGMLFVLCFLVMQAVAGDRRIVNVLIDAMTAAAAVSAALGLYEFLIAGAERAKGPVEDPNDFAFLLAMVVPGIVYRIRWSGGVAGTLLRILALLTIFGCILATFSRGGLVALAAAAGFAVLTRRLALRWVLVALVGMVGVGLLALRLYPTTVLEAFERKENVAQANIDTRFITWELAIEQFRSAPFTGVGPGNFEARYWEFALPYDLSGPPPPPHNAYLHVLAELGLPGFLLFLLYLALGWAALRRRSADPRTDALMASLVCGLVIALVGAVFLSEQYYAPFWVLPALGATLVLRSGRHSAEQDPDDPSAEPEAEHAPTAPVPAVAGRVAR